MTYKQIEEHFNKEEVRQNEDGSTTRTIRCEPWLNYFLNTVKECEEWFVQNADEDNIEDLFKIFGRGFNDGFEMASHFNWKG